MVNKILGSLPYFKDQIYDCKQIIHAITLFQDYDVLNLLGKGGFATVYKARCRRTFIEVAIKMVS